MRKTKYTKEFLEPIVEKSHSIADVLRNIGIGVNGGNHRAITGYIKIHDISTQHFTGSQWNKGSLAIRDSRIYKIPALQVLRYGKNKSAKILRRSLIEIGREHKCAICGLDPVWNGNPLILHIDHINAIPIDNRPENLRFVCPNCHQQTPTWGNQNPKDEIKKQKRTYTSANCKKCDVKISSRTKSGLCVKCSRITKVKDRPSKIALLDLLKNNAYDTVGKMYGVSGNAIRKWLV